LVNTEKNEAMNQSIAKCAPKGRDYSATGSLYRRVLAAVGVNSGGMHYFSKVLEKIGCCVPPSRQLRFFDTRDHQNTSKAPCVRCGGTDHKRSNSKKCRFFKGRSFHLVSACVFLVLVVFCFEF
jgi:hypothetical protein